MLDIIVYVMACIMALVLTRALFSEGAGNEHLMRYGRYIMLERLKNPHVYSCHNCAHHHYYTGPMGHRCYGRKKRVDNLRSFPFRTDQKCFKPQKMVSIYNLEDM